ncbi:MAG TPA: TonB family protein [Candidatus Acidoferrales bacterium]|nr:TonB family protein [Candidatus Acidoferrales bacterium]
MASITTELPISPAASKSKTGSDLEAEAFGLEVAVRVHGSQVAAVVLESTEHVEPFEEDTTTMIVFPRGAVVKLRARVRTGHSMVLTNLLTKQTALCRIIQVNTAPSIAHYVKLEFAQPTPGFWGVHFPSDPLPSARTIESPKTVSAPAAPKPLATPVAPVIQKPARVEAQPAPAVPPVRETTKPTPSRELNLSVPTSEYGNERPGATEDLVPLASGSPSADRKALSASRVPAVAPAKPKRASSLATEQPIFDLLTTQEEIFSREAAATLTGEEHQQEPTRQAGARASHKTIAAIDYSSLLQPASTPKRNSSVLIFAAAVVVVLAFVAAGAMYLRRNPKVTTQITKPTAVTSSSPSPSSSSPSSSQQPPAALDEVVTTTPSVPVTSSSTPPPQVQRDADAPAPVSATHRNSMTTGSEHVSQKSAAATGRPAISISTGMADIYAGDLKAHAEIKPRNAAHVTAPVPDVGAASSKEIPVMPNGNLGSLVSGVGGSNLVAPAPPEPDVVQGGHVQLPKLVSSVAPVYPQLAAANHVEGEVKIQAEINASGKVTSTKVVSGPILLRSAAVNAVRQWKYSPAMLDGKAISTQYVVTVRFRLNQ